MCSCAQTTFRVSSMCNWRLPCCLAVLSCLVLISTFFELQLLELRSRTDTLEASAAGHLHQQQQQQQQKHTESQNSYPDDDLVVIYNRVPKTGSTSFVGVAYDLCKRNEFHVLHINITANMHVLSLPNQYKFVHNVTRWRAMKPALYHGHMAFLDFSRLGAAHKPLYINIVRRPLDRLISYYYFLRYGDNFRPSLIRRKHGDTMTFDECVERSQPDCEPSNMWLQVPFFCGHAAECWRPGSRWALEKAKQNLVNNYLVVGVTEQMDQFIMVLEATLPRLFRGATEHYLRSNKSHLRQTVQKNAPSPETVAKIRESQVWQMENELYEFALNQFNFHKKRALLTAPDRLQVYMYEKIRPK